MPSLEPVMEVYEHLYPVSAEWTPPFKILDAIRQIRKGAAVADVAKALNRREKAFQKFLTGDPVETMFGTSLADVHSHDKGRPWKLANRGIGQMMLGFAAEQAFERLYKLEIGSENLKIEDFRQSRNDTDYRIFDGNGKALFRINIKAHGTPFRNALKLVKLDPEDCFALGTYKIRQGLDKEANEDLPYVFIVASVPGLTSESISQAVPDSFLRVAALVKAAKKVNGLKKRDIEDRIVSNLIGPAAPQAFVAFREQIIERMANADWKVLSAKRAELLLKDLFWVRVFALTERGFAQNYKNAEVDMHFKMSTEMTPLKDFLHTYTDGGQGLLISRLGRGII